MVGLTRMRVPKRSEHVAPERIWSFIYDHLELAIAEQRHLNVCVNCAEVFRLCVTCENFDRVIQEIVDDSEDLSVAA